MLRRTALSLALTGALACQPADPAISDQDVAALRETVNRYVATSLAGDFDAWASLLTADAVFLGPNAPPIEGRAAIRQWVAGFAGMASFTATAVEIAGAGDVAWARGTYAFAMGPTAAMQVSDSGKWLTVYERQSDGSWLIKRNIWNSDLPLPATP
jgi:uncharacterized protein (TIGR02246 family)